MRKAYVIFVCSTEKFDYHRLAIELKENIRSFDRNTDIIALTVSDLVKKEHRNMMQDKGLIIVESEMIPTKCFIPSEMSRLNVWKLTQYDKIICLDCDNKFLIDPSPWFNLPELSASLVTDKGFTHINTSTLVLEPSLETHKKIMDVFRSGEHFSQPKFNCRGGTQGVVTYYFKDKAHLLKDKKKYMIHIGQGELKHCGEATFKECHKNSRILPF